MPRLTCPDDCLLSPLKPLGGLGRDIILFDVLCFRFYTREALAEIAETTLQSLDEYESGDKPKHAIIYKGS
jgi:hypothetical protein